MAHDHYPRPMTMQRHAQKPVGKAVPKPEDPKGLGSDPDNPLHLPEGYQSDRVGRVRERVGTGEMTNSPYDENKLAE